MTSSRVLKNRPPPAEKLSTVDGLVQLSFLVHGTLERLAAEHKLSITQIRLLGILRDRQPSMNELARLLALDKSSVTGLVDRAERRGLVVRTPAATDKRSTLVGLTKTGRTLVSRAAADVEAEISTILDQLTPPDRKALTDIASRLLTTHATREGLDLFPKDTPSEQLP